MKSLRKPTKCDVLLELFPEVGDSMRVEEVLDITGIASYGSLRALFTYIRKAPHIPEENRIDVRSQEGTCIRVN